MSGPMPLDAPTPAGSTPPSSLPGADTTPGLDAVNGSTRPAAAPGTVTLTIHGPVARLHLDREAKLNTFTLAMLDQMEQHLRTLDADPDVRVVVVTTAGERVFSAGADVTHFTQLSPTQMWSTWIRRGHAVFDQLAQLRQVTVAAVDGDAYGGGLELALACDIRVLAESARVGLPEVGIGTIPGWGGTTRLAQLVGVPRAKRLVFTGELIPAERACDWGLVTDLAPRPQVVDEAFRLARLVASRAPIAVQMTKQVIDARTGTGIAMTLEALASASSGGTDDFDEGVGAFRQKRTPDFSGRQVRAAPGAAEV